MRPLYIIGALVLVGLGVFFYFTWPKDLITKVDPNLSQEQRSVLEQQLTDAQKRVDEINSDTSVSDKATIYSLLGRSYYNLGNYGEARKWFEKAVKTKRNIPVYLEYYNLLAAMHDYKGAVEIARDGLEIYPINIDLWRSVIALEQSQFQVNDTELTSLYLEALEKSGGQHELLSDFARYQEEKGNIEEALKYWKTAVAKAPDIIFYSDQVKRLGR